MKPQKFLVIALSLFAVACTKESNETKVSAAPSSSASAATSGDLTTISSLTTRVGSSYSKSIPIDTANRMIQSYLTSVSYPSQDSALRSLAFDADTLRAYLNDSRITTLKFVFAHKPSYMNGSTFGQYSGMKPDALTIIIAGLDNSDQLVRNSSNGVYDNMQPCPVMCGGETSAYLY